MSSAAPDRQLSDLDEHHSAGRVRGALERASVHLENAPVVITEWDHDFVLTYWSPQAEAMFGWKAEEVLGKTPFEFGFVHAEDVASVQSVVERLVRTLEPRNSFCNRNYAKDGAVHYCEWYNSALLDDNGRVGSILCITLDVTDRVRAEQEVRAREQAMRLAFQSAQIWFWEIDPDKGDILFSENAAPGYASPRMKLEDWLSALAAEDDQRVRDAIRATLFHGSEYDVEFRLRWPDGKFHWIYSRGSVFREGDRSRFLGIGMDITARKRTELELQESRERMHLAAEAARLCAWDWDLHTHQIRWSGDVKAVYARDGGDMAVLERFYECIHADDLDVVRAEIARCTVGQEHSFRAEFRVLWPDGSVHWVLGFGRTVFDAEGRAVRVVGVSLDQTERKRSEDALRRNDRLIATGRLAAALAHEINNPLAAVTNLLYLIDSTRLDAATREYVQLATAELSRVANITRNILGLYRESRTPVELEAGELLDSILSLYRRPMTDKDIRVVRKYQSRGIVRAFPGELRQVFSNLIGNALDASPRGGTLTFGVRSSGGRTHITVADTGAGIAPDHVKRIFEPFFTTKGEKGTGLGLWICRQILTKHGGDIRVRSRNIPGSSGTVFRLTLPGVGAS